MNSWQLSRRSISFARMPVVMGILNVTPDSFSDGGAHLQADKAIEAAIQMERDGAGIVDIGGESTRPYSESVATEQELSRVIPVIEGLQGKVSIPISIDTSKAAVAKAAIDAGAEIINDVTGLEGDPEMLDVAVQSESGVCVMHMQGTPQSMQDNPAYENVVEEIFDYLQRRKQACIEAGIQPARVCLDPGIGFGKSHEHNTQLIRDMNRFRELQSPILIGHSRKGFIGKLIGDKQADRMAGTLAVSIAAAHAGMQVVRVHDVRPTVDAFRVLDACTHPN